MFFLRSVSAFGGVHFNLTCVYITSPGGCHGGSVLFLLGALRFFCHDQHHWPRQGWRSESLQRILTLDYQDIPLILTVLPLQLCKTVIVWNPVIFVLMNPMVTFLNSIESLHCIIWMIPQTCTFTSWHCRWCNFPTSQIRLQNLFMNTISNADRWLGHSFFYGWLLVPDSVSLTNVFGKQTTI